jgi:predicted ester cyclase
MQVPSKSILRSSSLQNSRKFAPRSSVSWIPLMGKPPTGRSVRQNSMHFVRFRDGKGIEHWGCETTWA